MEEERLAEHLREALAEGGYGPGFDDHQVFCSEVGVAGTRTSARGDFAYPAPFTHSEGVELQRALADIAQAIPNKARS